MSATRFIAPVSRHPSFGRFGVNTMTPDDVERARELYCCGYDTSEIARQMMVSEAGVYAACFARRAP